MSQNTEKDANSVRHETIVKHPMQPLIEDEHGVIRFKENKVVRWLLDNGGLDMNDIARQGFSDEDREQFAQLIGYSHSGASELHYVSDTVLEVSETMYIAGKSDKDQRDRKISYLENRLASLRENLADALCDLFEVHPDDLKGA